MKVVEHGLVGKYVQCPTCATIFEFEDVDELEREEGLRYSLVTKFCIPCQECKSNIVVLERRWIHGPSPGQWRRQTERLNLVSHNMEQKAFAS